MEYYQELKVNLKNNYLNYYEWDTKDNIKTINNIPIIPINKKDFINLYKYNFILLDKTLTKYNYLIFCDKNNTLVIELDKDKSKKRSSVSYIDDEIICELIYQKRNMNIKYELLKEIKLSNESHKLEVLKNDLKKSLKDIDEYKLKYLYFEITNHYENNIDIIKKHIKKLIDELNIQKYSSYKNIIDELFKYKCLY